MWFTRADGYIYFMHHDDRAQADSLRGRPRAKPSILTRLGRKDGHLQGAQLHELISYCLDGSPSPHSEQLCVGAFRALVTAKVCRVRALPGIRQLRTRLAMVQGSGDDRRQESLRKGTIFARSHLSLSTWFRAFGIFVRTPDVVSARRLQRDLRIGCYATAFHMVKRIRSILYATRPALKGTVQIGELRIGDIWPKREHKYGDAKLLIAVSSRTQLALIGLYRGPFDAAELLEPHLDKDCIVETHNGLRYPFLAKWHSRVISPPVQSGCTLPPLCQGLADDLLLWLRRIHRHPPSLWSLQPYLDEYAFRRNYCKLGDERSALEWLIRLSVEAKPSVSLRPLTMEMPSELELNSIANEEK